MNNENEPLLPATASAAACATQKEPYSPVEILYWTEARFQKVRP
ncbi:Zinc finger CCCH domain-containing protein 42 [Zea mays]|uniref:Zinc finger CCCH domain-containing protein 42 n=1 Tax=Zea mays TaxID=4577 RepID=A0A1D6LA88_MAIZE|nr:Zinc finger CCCH domain-containing protein 42 [Zea mays]